MFKLRLYKCILYLLINKKNMFKLRETDLVSGLIDPWGTSESTGMYMYEHFFTINNHYLQTEMIAFVYIKMMSCFSHKSH